MNLIHLLKHDLPAETRKWIERGTISEKQGEEILGLYQLSLSDSDQRRIGYSVLTTIGLLFIGLAFLLVVGRNWEVIPPMLRLAGLLTLTIGLNSAGFLAGRRSNERAADHLFFLGSIIFGASIFLIAQTFQLSLYAPHGLMWWAIGIVPLLLGSSAQRFGYLFGVVSFLYMALAGADGYVPWAYPIFAALLFWWLIYRKESKLLYLLQVCGVIWFTDIAFHHLYIERFLPRVFFPALLYVHLGVGLLIVLAISTVTTWRLLQRPVLHDYSIVVKLWLARLGIFIAFLLSFDEVWENVLLVSAQFTATLSGITVVTGIAAALVLALRRINPVPQSYSLVEMVSLGIFLSLSLLGLNLHYDAAAGAAVLTNFCIVALGGLLIHSGIQASMRSRVIGGAAVLCALASVRYVDLIGDYLGAAILFTIEGAALIALARLLSRGTKITKEAI